MENNIYLDHAATSPIHPEVVQRMLGAITNRYGNPSSIHFAGREARSALDDARSLIAKQIQAEEKEIIFTSGGTESDNTAIIGAALNRQVEGKHIITTQIEHHAVLKTCEYLETQGFEVTYLPVDKNGIISIEDLKQALRNDTILVTIMHGNNEIGSIQPIAEIGALLKNHQAYFHTDAVQSFGLTTIHVKKLGIDLMSASSHKINGPRGVGFLYVSSDVKIAFPFHGGEQERGRRPGTENIAGICGFSEAARIMAAERSVKAAEYMEYKAHLVKKFTEADISFSVNGDPETTLPHIFSVRFPNVSIEQLLMNLDMEGVAASSGSACTAGTVDPSHVLVALYGEGSSAIKETVRISFGLGNTFDEVDQAADKMITIVQRLANRKDELT